MKVVKSFCSGSALFAILALAAATQLHAVAIEVQGTSIGSQSGGTGFITVNFVSTVFQDNGVTPLVFVIPTSAGPHPCDYRVINVTQTSFDVACVEPPGDDGPHAGMTLDYIAIEPGVHTIPATIGGGATTVTMAAGSVSTSQVQHGCSSPAICGTEGSTAFTFGTTFAAPPALLLEIQTDNSETGSPPGGVSIPWLTSTVVEDAGGNPLISTTGASVALERSEVQQGTVLAETMAWLAVEETLNAGSAACATLDFSSFGGPSAVNFQAVLTGAVIDGWGNGCQAGEGAAFAAGCFTSAPTVGASRRTRNEDDGGWLRRCTGGFNSTFARFTVDEDRNSGAGNEGDSERNHVDEEASVLAFGADFFTPVTLAWFRSTPNKGGLLVEWATTTETGNLGFALSERLGRGWQRVGQRLIASQSVDSTSPRFYRLEIPDSGSHELRLTDVSVRGRKTDHGPFEVGQEYGLLPTNRAIDWSPIRRQSDQRQRRRAALSSALPGGSPQAELLVSEDGLYRVTHEDLVAAGVDLSGAPRDEIALLLGDKPQRIRVESGPLFGAASYVEFYGAAVDHSLYTRTRVYRLTVDADRARRVFRDRHRRSRTSQRDYDATLTVDQNRHYSFASPTDDPWYAERLLSFGEPVSADFDFTIDRPVPGSTASLTVDLWGVTDFPAAPDHHAQLELNGELIWEDRFDGLVAVPVEVDLPAGALVEGENLLTLTLPGDVEADYDLVNFDRFSVAYRRELAAPAGSLEFTAPAAGFTVSELPTADIVAYRLGRTVPSQLLAERDPLVVASGNGFEAHSGSRRPGEHRFFVSTVDALLSPDAIRPATALGELDLSPADYLIVTHPDFADGLGDLIAAREAQGFSVRTIDVEELYTRFSDGITDPAAIRDFIALAHTEMGVSIVLLVGGDSYDYLDHLGSGSMSFVPTVYAQTGPIVRFAPADGLLADVDLDGFPDLPIGRLPVRTPDELGQAVAKTLAYETSSSVGTALFVADDPEPLASFPSMSDALADSLGPDWAIVRAHLDELGVDGARQRIIDTIEVGVGLTSFFGHSGPGVWTFDGLFTTADAQALVNTEPTVVVQWGCWNTYFVEPTFDTLAHGFLVSGPNGAAAVLGAGTLTTTGSEQALGALVLADATQPGVTLGQAVQDAKAELAATRPDLLDVILGWNLLGDPALRLRP